MADFIEGAVYYPDALPCPQVETDLVPRERRYISDITDVRNMRMFQQEFQATRNKISFVFTEEEAREFREWYENTLIYGGAWFYADWPILHKDKKISYRFVGQPKYQWLYGANPGAMGRSRAGNTVGVAPDAVTMYKVTATVELYEGRKVGKYLNVFTSKIYPYYFNDRVTASNAKIRPMPSYSNNDHIGASQIVIDAATEFRYIYGVYTFEDDATVTTVIIDNATEIRWIYSNYDFTDNIFASNITIENCELTARLVAYPRMTDDVTVSSISIETGEIS